MMLRIMPSLRDLFYDVVCLQSLHPFGIFLTQSRRDGIFIDELSVCSNPERVIWILSAWIMLNLDEAGWGEERSV